MYYSELVEVYEYLEKTSARLKKTDAIAELLKKTKTELLDKIVLLIEGKVFPSWSGNELGIAQLLMAKIISTTTGFNSDEVMKRFKKTGDFGLVIEELLVKKRQQTLFQKRLTVEKVFENLQKLASIEGKGSHDRKFQLVSELLVSAKPKEAKFIARTVIGDLRVGVAAGIIRDSVAKAFISKEDSKEAVKAVEWAWFLNPDYGEVAKIAKEKGISGLKRIGLSLGRPYHVALAEKSPSLEEALKAYEKVSLEYKYDGARLIIQKKDNEIWLFTRRLENISKQFPEVIELAKKLLKPKRCIVEGEMLAVDKKIGKPLPFQFLSQRIQRKYDIDKIQKEVPVQVNLFDITYLEGKVLFNEKQEVRREVLEKNVNPVSGRFQLAKQLVTKDLKKADAFYKEALRAGQEGLIVKNQDATYQPGRRVGFWLKVKPVMENLDLVIIGATWGTGKRTSWLGSLMLGCRDEEGNFLECGMIGTGIKEKSESGVTFEQLTGLLKPHIVSEKGNKVKIKPKVVVEVAYEEIQESPNYESKYALRFPRLLRVRNDKHYTEADTLDRIKKLYKLQQKRK